MHPIVRSVALLATPLAFACFVAKACIGAGDGPPTRRAKALAALPGCCLAPRTPGCEDDTGRYLVALARRGDDGVIPTIMTVSTCGDPAINDVLAPYLRTLLLSGPLRFVRNLAAVTADKQYEVVFGATMYHGDEIAPDDITRVRAALQRLGKGQGNVAAAARRCLTEFVRLTDPAPP